MSPTRGEGEGGGVGWEREREREREVIYFMALKFECMTMVSAKLLDSTTYTLISFAVAAKFKLMSPSLKKKDWLFNHLQTEWLPSLQTS